MDTNYWLNTNGNRDDARSGGSQRRISRRSAIRGMALTATGAGAFALVGCSSGGQKDTKDTAAKLGIAPRAEGTAASTAKDPFAGAKKGGTWSAAITSDPPTLDPYTSVATNTKLFASHVYSRLFKHKTGADFSAGAAPLTGDLAQSAEVSPDNLTWTIKLKPNAKFHNVAPVNGRAITSDDVKFSWERATGEKGINRSSLAFVEKVTYPDAQTIVFTLKEPNVAFLSVLADFNLLWIQPREADGRFNPKTTAVGSGPWIFGNYQSSIGMTFKRNPDWYESGFPLLDEMKVSIIPEYANQMAQFQAGSLDTFGPQSEHIIDLKKQMPNSQLSGDVAVSLFQWYFDAEPTAPWRDERVRVAMSKSLDRDALMDLAYNIKDLRAAGVKVTAPWNNMVPAGFPQFWLDPQSKDAGETAKSFFYDPAEAKKLLAAAGHPNGFAAKYQYTGNGYNALHNKIAEAQASYLNAIGVKTTIEVQDYNSKYYTQTYRGNFTGIAFGPETSFNEAGAYPIRQFTPNALNKSQTTDPVLTDLARAQQRETDPAKRRDLIWQIQRYHAGKMYLIPSALGAGTAWTMFQPWARNIDFRGPVGYGSGGESAPYYWKDR